mgnify:FL=1
MSETFTVKAEAREAVDVFFTELRFGRTEVVLEEFLDSDHVARLTRSLDKAVQRRRHGHENNQPHHGQTLVDGDNIRILHILADDPLFQELLDHPAIMSYVQAILSEQAHFHASDAFWETEPKASGPGWHIDGFGGGYRPFRPGIPLLQLKIGYFLSDMTRPGQGNLTVVPKSHRLNEDLTEEQRQSFDFPESVQVCVPSGTCILFHNALWHTRGAFTRAGGRRIMLYYAYELPWMLANPEHWSYPKEFYAGLTPEQRQLFHGFVFDPPEDRWY